jgi:hypothetical protein
VFLWEEDFATFNFEKYDPIKSNGILSREDLNLLERELKKSGYFKIGETSNLVFYIFPWVLFLALTVYIMLQYINKKMTNQIVLGGIIGVGFVLALLLTCYGKSRSNTRLK